MNKKNETPWQWKGLEQEIKKEGLEPCPVCNGTTQNVITGRKVCEDCNGTKELYRYKDGLIIARVPCNRCDEDGTTFYAEWIICKYCNGSGIRTWIDEIRRPLLVQYVTVKNM